MLTFGLILAAVCVWLELKIIKEIPFLGEIGKRWTLFPVIFSMALSYFIGMMFGAAGLTALLAGVMSTAMTQPVYWFRRQTKEKLKPLHQTQAWAKEVNETYHVILIIMKWILILTTAVVWLPVVIHFNKKNGMNAGATIKHIVTKKSIPNAGKVAA